MASKRRKRRRSCESKIRHSDKKSARKHARSLGKPYMAYHCSFCNGWHVGRPSRLIRKILAAKARNHRI